MVEDPLQPIRRPADLNARIWRYVSVSRLESLLRDRSLYFCRADQFEDPYEGLFPDEFLQGPDAQHRTRLLLCWRASAYASCWHLSELESATMWRLYASSGVILKSSFSRLQHAFPGHQAAAQNGLERIEVGLVQYDSSFLHPRLNSLKAVLHKQPHFWAEQEVRAFFVRGHPQAQGYFCDPTTPISELIKPTKCTTAGNHRHRRLSEEEETRLLETVPPFLRSMIITALDAGMRQGEMLKLRFGDIDWTRSLIILRGETTKNRKTRAIPMATKRLRAVLDWLRLDAAGERKADDALVFSDETGAPIGRFRTAWVTAVLKAHDVKPAWKAYGWTGLTPACTAEFKRINLHWHDLRHEYASRLVEKGVPLAQVRDLLGHTSITTTERYDNQTLQSLQSAAQRLERGRTFDASNPQVDGTKFQEFQDRVRSGPCGGRQKGHRFSS